MKWSISESEHFCGLGEDLTLDNRTDFRHGRAKQANRSSLPWRRPAVLNPDSRSDGVDQGKSMSKP